MHIAYTIGHSNHPIDHVLMLLARHGVTLVADVRSVPRSRFTPQFHHTHLRSSLASAGIGYEHFPELGARSTHAECYRDGKACWALMAASGPFQHDLARARHLLSQQRVALMCAERDPLDCHRAMLVGVRLCSADTMVAHILRDGALETHQQLEQRLLARYHLDSTDILRTREECLAEAYRRHGERLAFQQPIRTTTAPAHAR